jgi:uncharacterized RDD family membrane protein YckC
MPMLLVMNAIAQASAAPVTGPKLDNRRVLAGIVDLAIVAAGAIVVLFAGDALSGDGSDVQGALGAVILGWALYYYFALESGGGQTVGKKLMNLRVVCVDGSPVGMREVAVRTILRVIDGVGAYIVGLIVMLATGQRRQRLGDLAAGTMVIDASAAAAVAAPLEVGDEVAEVDEVDVIDEAEEPWMVDDTDTDTHADTDTDTEPPAGPESATITLPSRPAPPSTLADLSAPEAPAVPEMRPFPPVDEPADEVEREPVDVEPEVEVEPVSAERFAEDPLPEITSPSLEELARDVQAAQVEPAPAQADPAVTEEVAEPVEGSAEPVDEIAEPVDEIAEPVEDDGPVTVRSVETVSAIDLIMGGAAEDEPASEDSLESPQDGEDSASQ